MNRKQILEIAVAIVVLLTSGQIFAQPSALRNPSTKPFQISTVPESPGLNESAGKKQNETSKPTVIPFTVGDDHRIHVKGTINGSKSLDLIFDTGANGHAINSKLLKSDVKMSLDGTALNGSAGGFKTVQTSSSNKLTAGGMEWNQASFVVMDFGEASFDAVIGWNAFADNTIEINYDRKELLVYKESKPSTTGYRKFQMRMLRGLPYINSTVFAEAKGSGVKGWFEFDTGSDWSLQLSQTFAKANGLNGKMQSFGKSSAMGSNGISFDLENLIAPRLIVGDYVMYQIPISITSRDPPGIEHNDILGNRLLKRFNAVLDFRKREIYLKPNNLMHSPYLKELLK